MINSSNKNKKTLVIASTNLGKVKEIRELLLDLPFNVISQPYGLQVEETGKTFSDNAYIKACAVSKLTGHWALADDSGLSVEALNGAPGINSARYANSDEERINKLIKELGSSSNRNATFIASLCVVSCENILVKAEGLCSGKITKYPRGKNGFGYDPIFEVNGTGLTFAQMGSEQKKLLSHRGKAFNLLKPLLEKLIINFL